MKNLKKVKLPESLTKIGNNAFAGSGITEIQVPIKVSEIGDGCFSNCKRLAEFKTPYAS